MSSQVCFHFVRGYFCYVEANKGLTNGYVLCNDQNAMSTLLTTREAATVASGSSASRARPSSFGKKCFPRENLQYGSQLGKHINKLLICLYSHLHNLNTSLTWPHGRGI